MKSKLVLLVIFCTALISACEKEPEIKTKDYPLIQTNDVSEISNEGVTLNAEITNRFNTEIIDFGFVWGKTSLPDHNDYLISLKETGISDAFNAKIKSSIEIDEIYFVRAYVKTDKYLIYGNEVSFNGEGCLSPKINGFYPDSCQYGGDTIKIWGENFSYKLSDHKVYIGGLQVKILSQTGDTLYIETPVVKESANAKITIQVLNNIATSEKEIKLIYPWQRIGDFPGSLRVKTSAFTIENEAYVGGGKYGDSIRNDFWKYTPQTNTWSKIEDFPGVPRFSANFGTSGNNGFISFGYTIQYIYWEPVNDCWEYNPVSNSWRNIFQYPGNTDFNALTSVVYKDDYYVYNQATTELWSFSPNTGWSQKASSPIEPDGNYAGDFLKIGIPLNDQIIFMSSKSVWVYDPELDIWDLVKEMDESLGNFSYGYLIKGKIYLMSEFDDRLFEYNPLTNRFIVKTVLLPNRDYNYTSFVINNELFFGMGGCDVCNGNYTYVDMYKIQL